MANASKATWLCMDLLSGQMYLHCPWCHTWWLQCQVKPEAQTLAGTSKPEECLVHHVFWLWSIKLIDKLTRWKIFFIFSLWTALVKTELPTVASRILGSLNNPLPHILLGLSFCQFRWKCYILTLFILLVWHGYSSVTINSLRTHFIENRQV